MKGYRLALLGGVAFPPKYDPKAPIADLRADIFEALFIDRRGDGFLRAHGVNLRPISGPTMSVLS